MKKKSSSKNVFFLKRSAELVMYRNRADRDISATYGAFARALVSNRTLETLKLQKEDEPAHFHDPVAAAKILQSLDKNLTIIDVQGVSQNAELRLILKRNRTLRTKAKAAAMLLLLAKRFDKESILSGWPKEVVLMVAKDLFETRGDMAWK